MSQFKSQNDDIAITIDQSAKNKSESLYHFYPSVALSFLLTYLFHELFMSFNWSRAQTVVATSNFVYYPFFAYVITNNIYQVATHLLTAFTFAGKPIGMIPGGAKEDQSCLEFTLHNFIDVSGWLGYFVIVGKVNSMMSLLAAVHCGVGIVAAIANVLFQRYYIQTKHAPTIFHWFKIIFVCSDAIARSYSLWTLL